MAKRDGAIGALLPRDIPARDIITFARRAEAHGFDELWVVEDLGYRGGLVQAATVLAATTRIRVGVGLLAGRRPQCRLRRDGDRESRPTASRSRGHRRRPRHALVDAQCRSVAEEPSHAAGRVHHRPEIGTERRTRAPRRAVRPHRRRAPARDRDTGHGPRRPGRMRGPKSLAVSGDVADGTLLAEPVTPAYVREALKHIAPTRPHRLVAYNIAAIDEDPAVALTAVRPALEVVGEPDWRPHIAPLPFYDELVALRSRCDSPQDFARALPDEWVGQLAVAGTPGQARSRVTELFDAGVTSAVLTPVGDDYLASLDSLAAIL